MPTYEYECKSCSHVFDVFQSITEAPVKICPKCGKDVRRVINGGMGVIFKGSGFYVTDKNKGASASSKSSSRSTETSKSESAPCPGCAAAASCPKAVNS
jgi:putative FmdB family regulatory protein